MLRILMFALICLFPFGAMGQTVSVDERTENFSLEAIAKVYKDTENNLQIQQILSLDSTKFNSISHLNIGITYTTYWLKFTLKNAAKNDLRLFLALESITGDSVFLYKTSKQKLLKTTILGEYLPFLASKIKHRTPVFEIILSPSEQADFYLTTKGNGQPINLTASLLNATGFHAWDSQKLFITGLAYGILLLILIFNFSFFFITKEKIYLIFFIQTIFSTLGIIYFDGFVHQYLFPNSGYWSNEMIAIALCGTYIFNNLFNTDFFNLQQRLPLAFRTFRYLTYLIFVVLLLSFIHPWGFNFFIVSMTALTSLVAILLFVSLLILKRQQFSFYFFVYLATICLIIFGSMYQAFIMGFVPDTFFTQHSIHLAVVLQSVFLALAVNDKFRVIREENDDYQKKMVEALNQYSQNLIGSIEAERQRLAIDIHDGLGQNLLAMRNIILKTLKQKSLTSKTEETLQMLLETTTETLDDARAMAYNLRPPILNTMGLTVAIQTLVEKIKASSNLKIQFKMEQSLDGLVAKENEINVYRILQESFNNVLKHAKASKTILEIDRKVNFLLITFQDNGIGYNLENSTMGQGILGMKERVALLKGSINIESKEGYGTQIYIKIPIRQL
jgi:two-component system, sensor histidine kinase LadS